jgi:hypothetical protein
VKGEIGELNESLTHSTYTSLDDYFEKLDRYSRWWAEDRYERGRRAGALSVVFRPPARFVSMYLLRGGWMDGKRRGGALFSRGRERYGEIRAPMGKIMKPRITLITLGVDDLEESVAFYRDGLGLATKGIVGSEFEHGAVAFFDLQSGLKLAIWPRRDIAHDAGHFRGPAKRN